MCIALCAARLALRLLSSSTHDLRRSNLHPDLRKLVDARAGLAIVSGPTGSGKSTTLAALIEEINSSRARHIIVLESPIEYIFENRKSIIRQREFRGTRRATNRPSPTRYARIRMCS